MNKSRAELSNLTSTWFPAPSNLCENERYRGAESHCDLIDM